MRTLKEVHEAGWKGQEAEDFLAWTNAVEQAFQNACAGLDIDSVHGDWASADMFQNGTEVEDAVAELLPSWMDSEPQERVLDKYMTRQHETLTNERISEEPNA